MKVTRGKLAHGEALRIKVGDKETVNINKSGDSTRVAWSTPQLPSQLLQTLSGIFFPERSIADVRARFREPTELVRRLGLRALMQKEQENPDRITQASVDAFSAHGFTHLGCLQLGQGSERHFLGEIAISGEPPLAKIRASLEQTGTPDIVANAHEISDIAFPAFKNKQ